MRYKTIIEVITDADNEDEAIDKAGEYLRGACNGDVPLRVQTHLLNGINYKTLGYTIAICFVMLTLSFIWFSAGRTYQKIASTEQKIVETYAVHPPLNTDVKREAGKDFKMNWDRIYKEKILHNPDKNIKVK